MPAVVYEVNIDLHPTVYEAYIEWLTPHMKEMGSVLEGITGATMSTRGKDITPPADYELPEGEAAVEKWCGLTVSYSIAAREGLDDYLANRSATMRQGALDRFGKKMKASRRIMDVLVAY
jgi:hypothetical protein